MRAGDEAREPLRAGDIAVALVSVMISVGFYAIAGGGEARVLRKMGMVGHG